MTLDEFLKRLKKESNTIEDLKKGNYYSYLDALYKMIAYDGERLNKKHDLLITPYLQYVSKNKIDNFKAGLSKTEMEEVIESLKMDIDCMIFRIEQKN